MAQTMISFLTHLQCAQCGIDHDHRVIQTVCTKCGKSLLARYDLASARRTLAKGSLSGRPRSLWRYRELLPILDPSHIITLGEGYTPLLPLHALAAEFGCTRVDMKEEAMNPTGSFKARGLSMAVSKAHELGITELSIPTAGNAGSALAAYGAAAGMTSHIFLPKDTPQVNIQECRLYGATVHLVEGVISDAAREMSAQRADKGWFDVSTFKEPYRLEGKKTLGFEIAEQYDWELPDVIVYPTGGGTGLIGMWKAFEELEQLGWISADRPRMVVVQSSGCAPIVRAFEAGHRTSEFWDDATTVASGLRVPKAFADTLILDAVYASNGTALAVEDSDILRTIRQVAQQEGLLLSPEGAATVAAMKYLRSSGFISSTSKVLLYNTGSGLKYIEALALAANI
jgi:threonine synthase